MKLSRIILCSFGLLLAVACYGQNSDRKWKGLLESIEYRKYKREVVDVDDDGNPVYNSNEEVINGVDFEIEPGENQVNPDNGEPVSGGPNGRNGEPSKGLYRDFTYAPDEDFEGWERIDGDDVYNSSDRDDTWDDIRERWDQQKNGDGNGSDRNSTQNPENRRSTPKTIKHEKSEAELEQEKKDVKSNANWMVILGIIILAALIAYILYRVINNRQSSGNQRIDLNRQEERSPDEIPKTELELALEKSLQNGDYRAAIRVYFIFIMKGLVEKNWIEWEKEKTNLAYLREMSNRDEYNDFSQCVTIFEIVWYGKRDINENEFKTLETHFKKILDKLGVK